MKSIKIFSIVLLLTAVLCFPAQASRIECTGFGTGIQDFYDAYNDGLTGLPPLVWADSYNIDNSLTSFGVPATEDGSIQILMFGSDNGLDFVQASMSDTSKGSFEELMAVFDRVMRALMPEANATNRFEIIGRLLVNGVVNGGFDNYGQSFVMSGPSHEYVITYTVGDNSRVFLLAKGSVVDD